MLVLNKEKMEFCACNPAENNLCNPAEICNPCKNM